MDIEVSILCLCYNHSQFCIETLESIKSQSLRSFELIIIDDCSYDDSAKRINDWLRKIPSISHKLIINDNNLGVCKSANLALSHAKGTFVSMISCDDLYSPEHLRTLTAILNNTEYKFSYSDVRIIDNKGKEKSFSWFESLRLKKLPTTNLYTELLKGPIMLPVGTIIRREVFKEIGSFDESLSYEDYDMFLRLASRYKGIGTTKKMAYHRRHKHNLHKDFYSSHAISKLQILEKHRGINSKHDKIINKSIQYIFFRSVIHDINTFQKLLEYNKSKVKPGIISNLIIKNKALCITLNLINWEPLISLYKLFRIKLT